MESHITHTYIIRHYSMVQGLKKHAGMHDNAYIDMYTLQIENMDTVDLGRIW